MNNVHVVYAADLTPEEFDRAVWMVADEYKATERICWVKDKVPDRAKNWTGEWRSYDELPMGDEFSPTPTEVVFLGRDPRLFTAPRHVVPTSHALETVSYEVAMEMIGFFVDFVHPGFIHSLRERGIPLRLRGFEGSTTVGAPRGATVPVVNSIAAKRGVVLLNISTPEMWKQSGFLGKIFQACGHLGLSVDQVSASESEVTLTLDVGRETHTATSINALTEELGKWGQVTLESPCAAVTLVGTRIRSVLTQLAPVFQRFEEERMFLISQSAGDCNLTFVVEQSKADKLMRDLHALLFPAPVIRTSEEATPFPDRSPWWVEKRESLLKMSRHQNTPFFLLHEPTVRAQLATLMETSGCDRFLFAIKSNHHPELLRTVRESGVRFECVSPQEIDHLFTVFPDLTGEEILYTPNFASAEDFRRGFERGTFVTLDNHSPLEEHPELFSGRSLALRIDPGRGEGHHKHVKTAGRGSKFGIDLEAIDRTRERLLELDCKVIGLHCHAGSGIRDVKPWLRNARVLSSLIPKFPHTRFMDLGGGFGVPERPGEASLDLSRLKDGLAEIREQYPDLEIWLEPGRFIVAQAGALLTRVTQIKTKGEQTFIGVDAGMNSLIRPALYGAYHTIVNLSRLHEERTVQADIVGPICETGDVLGSQRLMPVSRPGDLFLVGNTGAYGRVMSSFYNMREPAPELWWTGNK
jgi:bifunctional diaminopimelate decarboxylase / aspartate kinase